MVHRQLLLLLLLLNLLLFLMMTIAAQCCFCLICLESKCTGMVFFSVRVVVVCCRVNAFAAPTAVADNFNFIVLSRVCSSFTICFSLAVFASPVHCSCC
uniref:Secreted peptide n=1 Tax=Anopheles braziliensis TaxID=58242 RepID=A0A2M3ZLI2_9DIPT